MHAHCSATYKKSTLNTQNGVQYMQLAEQHAQHTGLKEQSAVHAVGRTACTTHWTYEMKQ